MTAADVAKCAACGHPASEHHANGACYGLCGTFVSPAPSKPEGVKRWEPVMDGHGVFLREIGNARAVTYAQTVVLASDYDAKCAEVERLESYVRSLPADWFKDSSLKTWFPITAMQIEDYQSTIATLQSQLAEAQRDAEVLRNEIVEACIEFEWYASRKIDLAKNAPGKEFDTWADVLTREIAELRSATTTLSSADGGEGKVK